MAEAVDIAVERVPDAASSLASPPNSLREAKSGKKKAKKDEKSSAAKVQPDGTEELKKCR